MTTLSNALRVLSLVAPGSPRLRVSEVARLLDLPKSSVSRLFKELAEGGFLERDEDRGFRVGPELFRLGVLYRMRLPAEVRVDEELQKLVHRHGATAYVGVLSGSDLVVLRRHEGSSLVRFIQEPGSTIPAYATAVGKALLARLSNKDLTADLPRRLTCEGREIDMTREELLRELETVRRQGYAEFDDRLLGVGALGVAIQVAPGRDLGFALCFTRDSLVDAERHAIACELRDVARSIGVLCDDPFWTVSSIRS